MRGIILLLVFLLGLFLLPPVITCTPLVLIYLALYVYVFVNYVPGPVRRGKHYSIKSGFRNEDYFRRNRR